MTTTIESKGYIGDRKDILQYIKHNTASCASKQMGQWNASKAFCMATRSKYCSRMSTQTQVTEERVQAKPDRSGATDFSNILDFKDLPLAVQAAQLSVDQQHYGSIGGGSFKHTGTN